MVDIVSQEKRSQMMAGIKSENTKPEMLVRKYLHRKGLRFRVHVKNLAGKPDIVLKKHNCIIFINGCFWHLHGCKIFKMPSSRREFWETKLNKNVENQKKTIENLTSENWRVLVIWECALKNSKSVHETCDGAFDWILSGKTNLEIGSA